MRANQLSMFQAEDLLPPNGAPRATEPPAKAQPRQTFACGLCDDTGILDDEYCACAAGQRAADLYYGKVPVEWGPPKPILDTSALTSMQRGRVDKALDRRYNFCGEGVTTLRAYLERHARDWCRKSSYTRHYEAHKRNGCYNKLKTPHVEYTVWRVKPGEVDCNGHPRETGIDVPKIVYDLLDLPSTHKEQHH